MHLRLPVRGQKMDYIDKLVDSQPRLVEPLSKLGDLFNRKLWHQLTDEVVAFLNNPTYVAAIQYDDFYTVRNRSAQQHASASIIPYIYDYCLVIVSIQLATGFITARSLTPFLCGDSELHLQVRGEDEPAALRRGGHHAGGAVRQPTGGTGIPHQGVGEEGEAGGGGGPLPGHGGGAGQAKAGDCLNVLPLRHTQHAAMSCTALIATA